VLLGTAVHFTTLPLSVTFDRNGFNGLLLDTWVERTIYLAIAAVLWGLYARLSRRLRVEIPGDRPDATTRCCSTDCCTSC
jgi:hypothetical protein